MHPRTVLYCFVDGRSRTEPIMASAENAHGKEAELSSRRVADAPELSVIGRRSAVTLNRDL